MSDLFKYLFYTNVEREYYRENYTLNVDICSNKLCGVLYGAVYGDAYDNIPPDNGKYWGSYKYVYYDGEMLVECNYYNNAMIKYSYDEDILLSDAKKSDIVIQYLIYPNKGYEFEHYGVIKYVYMYRNKKILVSIGEIEDNGWDIEVCLYDDTGDYLCDIDANTNTRKYKIYKTDISSVNKNGISRSIHLDVDSGLY